MSYCRNGDDSDVYVIPVAAGIECVGCDYLTSHPDSMIVHLLEQHLAVGKMVPDRAFLRLLAEVREGASS